MTRLIGIGGRLRAGKDTVADYLVERCGFTKLGMSDPLLEAALVLDPILYEDNSRNTVRLSEIVDAVGYTEAKKEPEVRRFLQVLGTDFGRNMIGENVWVNIAARSIDGLRNQGHDVVITGIRFENELGMVNRLGGQSWWVDRDTDEPASDHASENGVAGWQFDTIINNNGSLDDLYAEVERIL